MSNSLQVPKQSKEVAVLTAQVASFPRKLQTEDDLLNATDLILKVRKLKDAIEEKKVQLVKPAKDALKQVTADYDVFLEPLETAEVTLRGLLEEYVTDMRDRDVSALLAARGDSAEDIEQHSVDIKTIPSDAGDIRFRDKVIITSVDSTRLPACFLVPDMKAIQKHVDSGELVAGVATRVIKSLALYVK